MKRYQYANIMIMLCFIMSKISDFTILWEVIALMWFGIMMFYMIKGE